MNMTKSFILVILLGFALSLVSSPINADTKITGKLHLRNGKTVDATAIHFNRSKFILTVNDVKQEIPLNDIRSIHFLKVHYKYGLDHYENNSFNVVLKNGKEFIASAINNYDGNHVKVTHINKYTNKKQVQSFEIDGSAEENEDGGDIVRIDFQGAGEVMYSPTTNRTFPENFSYDPFTGEKLVPHPSSE